jgi:integrase/recombinase XerD
LRLIAAHNRLDTLRSQFYSKIKLPFVINNFTLSVRYLYDHKNMLTLYRRHRTETDDKPGCPKQADRYWKRCNCPMWVEGTTNKGNYIRQSLKTRSWEEAQKKIKKLEEDGEPLSGAGRKEIAEAVREFLADMRARGLSFHTIYQAESMFERQLLGWCERESYKYLNELDIAALRGLRETWKHNKPASRKEKQTKLRQFFNFCKMSGWLKENSAHSLSRIRVTQKPTDYFTRDEMERLLSAALIESHSLYALILLMRWSGLRVTDAVTLERRRVMNGELMLYQAKTGIPVRTLLPDKVLDALEVETTGKENSKYFFWSGTSRREFSASGMQQAFRKLVKDAIPEKRCHPHMLRDTFAIEMLLAGVPLEQVSILLGHKNVAMTARHYMPFVKARQDQLTASVRMAWASAAASSSGESES